MLLADLEALEAAYDARGYRVAFDGPEAHTGRDAVVFGEVTRDDGSGWPTAEEAEVVAARVRRIGGLPPGFRNIRVIGPDGAEVEKFDGAVVAQTATSPAPSTPPVGDGLPAAATEQQPQSPPADAFPVTMGLPLGPVTVLALPAEGGPPSERALVGDGGGAVYCCYRGELEGREGVRWRAKQTTFESVNVTPERSLDFHDLYWPAVSGAPPAALAARVAFWGGEGDNDSGGLWWVLRRREG